MTIKILLADDHAILRDGLRAVLQAEAEMEIVGEAKNGREAVELANKLCPDVIVMDIGMPDLNGVDAARQVLSRDPAVKIIALSTYSDKQFVLAMLEAGAKAYVIKAAASDELLRAIRAVIAGQKYLSPVAAAAVVDSYMGKQTVNHVSASAVLTAREREVLQLLAEGKSSKQIGKQLSISENTVEVHRRNFMKKLDLHTVAELTKYAVREGITHP